MSETSAGSGHPADRGGRPPRSRSRRLFLAAAWILAVLLAAEAGVRVVALVLRRDDLFAHGDPGRRRTIYCVGDSFTYGLGVRPEQAWPRLLEGILRRSAGGALSVNNLGFPGLSSSSAYSAVARALKQGDAAAILLMAGWNANDADFLEYAKEKDRPVPLGARLTAILDHSRLFRLIRQAATYRRRTVVLDDVELAPQSLSMSMYDFRAYQEIARANLTRIARLCRDLGVYLVLLNYPYQDLPPNPYSKNEYYHVLYGRTPLHAEDYVIRDREPDEIALHAVIRTVGATEDIPVVDFEEAFRRSGRTDLFQADWHHPNAAGHAIMAQAVFDDVGAEILRRLQ